VPPPAARAMAHCNATSTKNAVSTSNTGSLHTVMINTEKTICAAIWTVELVAIAKKNA
jgi:hypothetical protein